MRPSAASAWSTRDIARLRAMREAGIGYKEIAFAIGRTEAACATKAHQYGIYKRREISPRIDNNDYTAPRSEARARSTTRPCLNCLNAFRSEGPHNRLCPNCRGVSLSPLDVPARVGR